MKRALAFVFTLIVLSCTFSTVCFAKEAPTGFAKDDEKVTVNFTEEEQAYISINSASTITVGQIRNRFPVSCIDEQTGVLDGINEDFLAEISAMSGLNLVSEPIALNEKPMAALKAGKFDMVMGIVHTRNFAEDPEIMLTDVFLSSTVSVVMKSGTEYNEKNAYTIALKTSFQAIQEYVAENYPQYSVKLYTTDEEGLEAIQSGEVDITMQNVYVTNYLLQKPQYSNLEILPTTFFNEESAMAALSTQDPCLVSIINKCIAAIPSSTFNNIILANTTAQPYHLTAGDLLYKYRVQIIILTVLVLMCIVLLCAMLSMRQKNYKLITEKNIQLAMEAKKADSANTAKSQFLAQMSHEIRTPMNAIIGLTEIAKTEIRDPEKVNDYLTKIDGSSRLLLSLINDVLDMSKIESGKLVLNPEPYEISELKGILDTIIGEQCRAKGVLYSFETGQIPDEERRFLVDRTRFNQIVMNLLSNAVKFTPPGGAVTVQINSTRIAERRSRKEIRIRDTGCGMSPEFLPHAFESYSQEEARQKYAGQQGTGLGLAIVKQLVTLMGGEVSVTSELGKGTEFVVVLDVPLATEQTAQSSTASEISLMGKRILLCEDQPLNTKIAIRLLEKKGLIVDTAENGLIGVERYNSSAPNFYSLILMDIRMPVMDGLEATKIIRALNKSDATAIPIVAMTANAYDEDRKKSEEAGMNAHLAKPIEPAKLYETLSELIKSRESER